MYSWVVIHGIPRCRDHFALQFCYLCRFLRVLPPGHILVQKVLHLDNIENFDFHLLMYFLPRWVGRHHIIHECGESLIILLVIQDYGPDYGGIIRISNKRLCIFGFRGGCSRFLLLVSWLWYAIKVNLVKVIFPVKSRIVRVICILTGLATILKYNLNLRCSLPDL
jgi:hypothetical protein